jgi:hypothetical protein
MKTLTEVLKKLPKPSEKLLPIDQLYTDPNIQIRMKPGDNVFGFQTNFDTGRKEGLKARILNDGEIFVPLWVWKTDKDRYCVLRGNTRLEIAREIANDPTTPVGIVDHFKKLKCIIYEGLEMEQAQALVNDQDQVRYNKADFVNYCWKLAKAGFTAVEIGMAFPEMYAEYIGTQEAKNKLFEYQKMSDKNAQRTYIHSWTRGELDQGILLAMKLGPRVMKCFILDAAKRSGILNPPVLDANGVMVGGDEQPEFNPRAKDGGSPRLQALKKALSDGNPNPELNEQFKTLIQKYIDEDAGIKDREVVSRPNIGQLKSLKDTMKSSAFKVAYGIAAGEKLLNAEAVDALSYKNEQIMEVLKRHVEKIKNPDVAALIATLIHSENVVELEARIQKFCS